MFYTYILRGLSHPNQRYIGSTSDLKSPLRWFVTEPHIDFPLEIFTGQQRLCRPNTLYL